MFRLETPGGGGYGVSDEELVEMSLESMSKISIAKSGSLHQYSAIQESA